MAYSLFEDYNLDNKIAFAKNFKISGQEEQLEWANKNFIIGNLYTFDLKIRAHFDYGESAYLYVKNSPSYNNERVDFNSTSNPILLFIGVERQFKIGYDYLTFLYNNKKHALNICEAWMFEPFVQKQ